MLELALLYFSFKKYLVQISEQVQLSLARATYIWKLYCLNSAIMTLFLTAEAVSKNFKPNQSSQSVTGSLLPSPK